MKKAKIPTTVSSARRRLTGMLSCRINGETCEECGIVHGKEAEELRCAVEEIIADYAGRTDAEFDYLKPPDVAERLQRLLDDVDARDALAYVNAAVRKRGRRRPPVRRMA